MKIRAVIFDLYKTLLEVGPPPANAEARWETLGREMFGGRPRVRLADFADRCETIIAREHAEARRVGIPFPEIFWPAVTAEALPDLARLSPSDADEFSFRHAQMARTIRLMPGAAQILRLLQRAGIPLGMASNAQPYTLRELDTALAAADLTRAIFTPVLCFLSFDHGFSKPDPHAFRLLTARLRALGIAPGETLMVGDRCDNDIAPAQAQGWQTWHLDANTSGVPGGDWEQLRTWLRTRLAEAEVQVSNVGSG